MSQPPDTPPSPKSARPPKSPAELARRYAAERERRAHSARSGPRDDGWRRETFTLPRPQARDKAREFLDRWPKAAYMTEVEFWRELADGSIEFTMRRLPTAD